MISKDSELLLTSEERRLLGDARASLEPTDAQNTALFDRLQAALPPGTLPKPTPKMDTGSTPELPHAASCAPAAASNALNPIATVAWKWPAICLGLGLALGGWGGSSWQKHLNSESARPSLSASRKAAVTEHDQDQALTINKKAKAKMGGAEPPLQGAPPHEQAIAPGQVGQTHKKNKPTKLSREVSDKPSFYEEMSYLRRAQTALRQGNAALALGLMKSLDEELPGGALLSERAVTKVLALCQLGQVEQATAIAVKLHEGKPDSVYSTRLAASCADIGSD